MRTGGAAAAAAAAAAVVAVAVTPVLGWLALAVPRGGVVRLKRDIAPLSATQLVALLREAGADDGGGMARGSESRRAVVLPAQCKPEKLRIRAFERYTIQ